MTSSAAGCPTPRSPRCPTRRSPHKKGQAVTARLIVRRVKDLNQKAAAGQGELFTAWRYHAVFTDSPFATLQAEEHHRGHAQAEQVFADWTDGPLAHLPVRLVPRERGLAGARRHQRTTCCAPPASLASLAYAKARGATAAPRPHRRRRPHRPPRPRAHHRAPARRLAPRARMDEPVRRRLRPARRRGLTSPDPVTAPRPPAPATGQPKSPARTHGQAAEK